MEYHRGDRVKIIKPFCCLTQGQEATVHSRIPGGYCIKFDEPVPGGHDGRLDGPAKRSQQYFFVTADVIELITKNPLAGRQPCSAEPEKHNTQSVPQGDEKINAVQLLFR